MIKLPFFLKELLLLLQVFILSTFLPPRKCLQPLYPDLAQKQHHSLARLLRLLCSFKQVLEDFFKNMFVYLGRKKQGKVLWKKKFCASVVDKLSGYQGSRLDRRTSQTDSLFLPNLFLFILSSLFLWVFPLNRIKQLIVWIPCFNKLEISLSKSNPIK